MFRLNLGLLVSGVAAARLQQPGPGECAALHCAADMIPCGKDSLCLEAVECLNKCASMVDDKAPGCCYLCEMQYGENSPAFKSLLHCMQDNHCLGDYPQDGTCLAKDSDAVQNITSLDQIAGDWWVLKGINCGQLQKGNDTLNPTPGLQFPGGYDWYPCQHERFVKSTGHDFPNPTSPWVNNITYCGGGNGGLKQCVTTIIDTVANITLSSPGVVHHLYTDAPLLPQDEYWRVVSWPHPDYVFVIWCGNTPVVPYNGGIILGRNHRDMTGMPQYVADNFQVTAKRFGVVYDQMCPSSNVGCP